LGLDAPEGRAGDWKLLDGDSISYMEIKDLVTDAGFKDEVKIISDCNYSGYWPTQAYQ